MKRRLLVLLVVLVGLASSGTLEAPRALAAGVYPDIALTATPTGPGEVTFDWTTPAGDVAYYGLGCSDPTSVGPDHLDAPAETFVLENVATGSWACNIYAYDASGAIVATSPDTQLQVQGADGGGGGGGSSGGYPDCGVFDVGCWLSWVWCAVRHVAYDLIDLAITAFNALVSAIAALIELLASLLPDMPTSPPNPASGVLGGLNWAVPIAPLLGGLTAFVSLWVSVIVVRTALRWVKAL